MFCAERLANTGAVLVVRLKINHHVVAKKDKKNSLMAKEVVTGRNSSSLSMFKSIYVRCCFRFEFIFV